MSEETITLPVHTVRALFNIYHAWWNVVATMDSDNQGLNFISIDDTQLMDDLCEVVEEKESPILLALKLGVNYE